MSWNKVQATYNGQTTEWRQNTEATTVNKIVATGVSQKGNEWRLVTTTVDLPKRKGVEIAAISGFKLEVGKSIYVEGTLKDGAFQFREYIKREVVTLADFD